MQRDEPAGKSRIAIFCIAVGMYPEVATLSLKIVLVVWCPLSNALRVRISRARTVSSWSSIFRSNRYYDREPRIVACRTIIPRSSTTPRDSFTSVTPSYEGSQNCFFQSSAT